MGFQMLPQMMGLSRQPSSEITKKHVTNGEWIVKELGDERVSDSTTIDHSLSYLNEYEGDFTSGAEAWRSMVSEADEYRQEYTDKNGTFRSRKLPKKSVIAIAAILKPPVEAVADWPPEKVAEMVHDGWEVMAEICPSLFREENLRIGVTQYDEAVPHGHRVWMCREDDEKGTFCGKLFDAKLRVLINTKFAPMMRDRGWPIDDPDTAFVINEDGSVAQRVDKKTGEKVKPKRGGKSQRAYVAAVTNEAEQSLLEAQQTLEDAKGMKQAAERDAADAETALQEAAVRVSRVTEKEDAVDVREKSVGAREKEVDRKAKEAEARASQTITEAQNEAESIITNAKLAASKMLEESEDEKKKRLERRRRQERELQDSINAFDEAREKLVRNASEGATVGNIDPYDFTNELVNEVGKWKRIKPDLDKVVRFISSSIGKIIGKVIEHFAEKKLDIPQETEQMAAARSLAARLGASFDLDRQVDAVETHEAAKRGRKIDDLGF